MVSPAGAARGPFRIVRPVLEALVAVVFLLLVWNNFTLRRQHAVAAAASRSARAFAPKDALAAVPVVDVTGKRRSLDLTKSRTTVVIVDPRCDSCREIIAELHSSRNAVVLSIAPLEPTAAMANQTKTAAPTYTVGAMPSEQAARFRTNPQILLVDQGRVVRTCAALRECA